MNPSREDQFLIATTRSDDRHLGGSAARFAMTRQALQRLGPVNVVLFADADPEMDFDPNRPDVNLVHRRSRRRPDRALIALNAASSRTRALDRMIQGRWAPDRPVSWDGVDVLWFFKMSTFVRWAARIPPRVAVVLDFDDLEENTRTHGSAVTTRLDSWGTARLRQRLAHRVDAVCVCSERDRYLLRMPGAQVLPNAVQLPSLEELSELPTSANLIFVGRLDYLPNRTAITWFADEVLPLIVSAVPTATLRLVGPGAQHLTPRVRDRVDARGAVRTLDEHYAWARLSIAPLRTGSGTRVKILEAMSYGRPVVSTTLGAEGIDALPGRDLLLGDDREALAAACVRVLTDDVMAQELATNGRDLVERGYSSARFEGRVADVLDVARARRNSRVRPG